ncbi:MAG: excinuclease ABC subunit UvrA, partial [Planctomycetia bacterium]|nr:excinuclease ABC subunit UvrA [Planctomycetia bacterium]
RVVAEGTLENILESPESQTADFLSGRRSIPAPPRRPVDATTPSLILRGARHNNLKNVDVRIPLGRFVCITGVSGSGKSSLVTDILTEVLNRELNHGVGQPGAYDSIEGLSHLDKMISIDQSPIGRTPRSNPATYIKLMDEIRGLFAQLPESKLRGWQPGRFSFNVAGGRCELCEGHGAIKLDMDFLADVWVSCPVCEGRRFNHETLQVRFRGHSIADVLDMDVQSAMELFENVPGVYHRLKTLHDVGMDYVKLGQPSPTLSGGEAQRVKLAKELAKIQTGRTFYILDEPTTGLHFSDVETLLQVLQRLVDAGNTVLVVEHHPDVIRAADRVIDLGPEGGVSGGRIVAEGTPEQIAEVPESYTGQALKQDAERIRSRAEGGEIRPSKRTRKVSRRTSASLRSRPIVARGVRQNNLKNIDVTIPGGEMTVCCGPSGSGKSSLAMETIYAEGQRRYVESLSAYARQFVGQMEKPKLEHIEGLSPAIAIGQKHTSATPRSTVGTVTEIHDYLRILMARLGVQHCPECGIPVGTQTTEEITDRIMSQPPGTKLLITAPLDVEVSRRYETLWEDLKSQGYARIRIDGVTCELSTPPKIDRRRRHDVEVILDRVVVHPESRGRIGESVETAISLGRGTMRILFHQDGKDERQWRTETASIHFVCPRCGRSFQKLVPQHFSFNSPLGWCQACEGLGIQTGASTELFLSNPRLSLEEGAIRLFPEPGSPLLKPILEAFRTGCGCPIDVPFEQLSSRWRRMILHGTGDQWFEVTRRMCEDVAQIPEERSSPTGKDRDELLFRYRYRGVYPSLEMAGRLSREIRDRTSLSVGEVECTVCMGSRIQPDAAAVRIFGWTLDDLCRIPLRKLLEEIRSWTLSDSQKKIAGELLKEVTGRLEFLVDVGLDYLTLGRGAPTLSGGESQRIRLASQLGSGLVGVLYVLDEPTIGLHPRDNHRLIAALKKLKDLGNTLLLVEHDREVIASADQLLDFGPESGTRGGEIVSQGSPSRVAKSRTSVTGPYLSGKKKIPVPSRRRVASIHEHTNMDPVPHSYREIPERTPTPGGGWLTVVGASQNNLRKIDVPIPLGAMTVITGVSGSGKSSLAMDILYRSLARSLHRAGTVPGDHETILGVERINKVICVDQQPIGQTPTSNPATFTGVFELIRDLFAQLPESRIRGFTARRFSFNVPGGRCEKCEGNGRRKIEMHFLPDVWVTCDACGGKRYEPETLSVTFNGRSIADVLEMSVEEALRLFRNIPSIRRILQTLCDVGLGYLTLGHPAPDLSGGESQRVKLAAELSRPDTGRTLYLLDEPTTGLHFTDLENLLEILNRLIAPGNTVVVIEHNLDLIKTADWIVELGPEAGYEGGRLVAAGTPEDIVEHARHERSVHGAPPESAMERPASSTVGRSRKKRGSTDTVDPVQKGVRKKAGTPEYRSADPRAILREYGGVVEESEEPDPLRSYTGEALIPVLAEAVFEEPKQYETIVIPEELPPLPEIMESPSEATSSGGKSLTFEEEVSQVVKMPWEEDGRTWHTKSRVARNGKPCHWDGRILAELVDRIESEGGFSPTDWSQKTTVEIRSEKKSEGWFLHAITGEEWLLKLKFRVAGGTFGKELVGRLGLASLNETPSIPLYGNDPRTRIQTVGAWQEVELRVCTYEEVDRPEYREFIGQAIEGFRHICDRQREKPQILSPWKQLGERWHLNPKGFPIGRRCGWDHETLGKLVELIRSLCPEGRWTWTNRTTVPIRLDVTDRSGKVERESGEGKKDDAGRNRDRNLWAYLHTKRPEALYLVLHGRKGAFTRGRLNSLPGIPELDDSPPEFDRIRFTFMETTDVTRRDFRMFLEEHLADALRNL